MNCNLEITETVEVETSEKRTESNNTYTFIFQDESTIEMERTMIEKFKTSIFYSLTKEDKIPNPNGYYVDITPDNFNLAYEFMKNTPLNFKDKTLEEIYALLDQLLLVSISLPYSLFCDIQLRILNNLNIKCLKITNEYPLFSIYYPKYAKTNVKTKEKTSISSTTTTKDGSTSVVSDSTTNSSKTNMDEEHYYVKSGFHMIFLIWERYYDETIKMLEEIPYLSFLPFDKLYFCFQSSNQQNSINKIKTFMNYDFTNIFNDVKTIKLQETTDPSVFIKAVKITKNDNTPFYNTDTKYIYSSGYNNTCFGNLFDDDLNFFFEFDQNISMNSSLFFDLHSYPLKTISAILSDFNTESSQTYKQFKYNTEIDQHSLSLINNQISVDTTDFEDRMIYGKKLSEYKSVTNETDSVDNTNDSSLISISFNSLHDYYYHPMDHDDCPFVYMSCVTDKILIKTVLQCSKLSLLKGIEFTNSNIYAICKYIQPNFITYYNTVCMNPDPNWIVLNTTRINCSNNSEEFDVLEYGENNDNDENDNDNIHIDINKNTKNNNIQIKDVNERDTLQASQTSSLSSIIIRKVTIINRTNIHLNITDSSFIKTYLHEYNEPYKIYTFYYSNVDCLDSVLSKLNYKYMIHPSEVKFLNIFSFCYTDMDTRLMNMIKDIYKSVPINSLTGLYLNCPFMNKSCFNLLDELFMNGIFSNVRVIKLLNNSKKGIIANTEICKQVSLYIQQNKLPKLKHFDYFDYFISHNSDLEIDKLQNELSCYNKLSNLSFIKYSNIYKNFMKQQLGKTRTKIFIPALQCCLRCLSNMKNNLSYLILHNMQITDNELISILDICMEEKISVKEIDISNNEITDTGIYKLIEYIKTIAKDSLVSLYVNENSFTKDSFKQLIDVINTVALNVIYFDALATFKKMFSTRPFTLGMLEDLNASENDIKELTIFSLNNSVFNEATSESNEQKEHYTNTMNNSDNINTVATSLKNKDVSRSKKVKHMNHTRNVSSKQNIILNNANDIKHKVADIIKTTVKENILKCKDSTQEVIKQLYTTSDHGYYSYSMSYISNCINIRNNLLQYPTSFNFTDLITAEQNEFDLFISLCKQKKFLFLSKIDFRECVNRITDKKILELCDVINKRLLPSLKCISSSIFKNISELTKMKFILCLKNVAEDFQNIPSISFNKTNQQENKQILDCLSTGNAKHLKKLENIDALQYDLFIYLMEIIRDKKLSLLLSSITSIDNNMDKPNKILYQYKLSNYLKKQYLSPYELCVKYLIDNYVVAENFENLSLTLYVDLLTERGIDCVFKTLTTFVPKVKMLIAFSVSNKYKNEIIDEQVFFILKQLNHLDHELITYGFNNNIKEYIMYMRTKFFYDIHIESSLLNKTVIDLSNTYVTESDICCIASILKDNTFSFDILMLKNVSLTDMIAPYFVGLLAMIIKKCSIQNILLRGSYFDLKPTFKLLLPLFESGVFKDLLCMDITDIELNLDKRSSIDRTDPSDYIDPEYTKMIIPYLSKTKLIKDAINLRNIQLNSNNVNSLLNELLILWKRESVQYSLFLKDSCEENEINTILKFIYTNKIKLTKLEFGTKVTYCFNEYFNLIHSLQLVDHDDYDNIIEYSSNSHTIDYFSINSQENFDKVYNMFKSSNSCNKTYDIHIEDYSYSSRLFTIDSLRNCLSDGSLSCNFFKNVKEITISNKSLENEHIKVICDIISSGMMNNFKVLDLSNNRITDEGAENLVTALNSSSIYLSSLNVSSNLFTDKGKENLNTLIPKHVAVIDYNKQSNKEQSLQDRIRNNPDLYFALLDALSSSNAYNNDNYNFYNNNFYNNNFYNGSDSDDYYYNDSDSGGHYFYDSD